ncbi:endonuclease/exonuclease/phosphatase family protein [Maribellus sp. YY47]|uniref:endonuclease/exonuclease/phosphatase family protein n=1 Tax=Maribellus sp. YY47 TaxID=2929486 RepID=UPI002000D006|nr:endonuclease/exonuclease/phosphatase family protein [Maribellus sp. YY47]MCK3685563.1 endonuclease/exonuclease/phosphatase family protein [Maribellus sp. YY47]
MKYYMKLKWVLLITLLIISFSCKEDSEEPAYLDISSNELIFLPEGGQEYIAIKSNRDFSVESSATWCTTEINSSSENNLKISVTANETVGEKRTAEITITSDNISDKIVIGQFAVEPVLEVNSDEVFFNEKETLEFALEITTNVSLEFELPEWIIQQGNDGQKTYSFKAEALPEVGTSRSGNIIIKSANQNISKQVVVPVRQTNKDCVLRVASYNLWVNEASWPTRKDLVKYLIHNYDFDIFGTQEGTLKNHLTDITESGYGDYAYIGEGRDGGQDGEYSAIIYKVDRFEPLQTGNFWFSETPDIPSIGWDAAYNRICSWGKFRDIETGCEFYFFNSHFDNEGSTAKLESAKLLLSKMKLIAGDSPAFSTGDFNSKPTTTPIQTILNDGLLSDSYDLSEIAPYGSFGTFNGQSEDVSTKRIDYVFVTSQIKIKEYGVLNDRPNGQFPSDHDPVLIIAEF